MALVEISNLHAAATRRRGALISGVAAVLAAIGGQAAMAQTMPTTQETTPPPREWIDADTGHRVHRLTDEPNSVGFYFNFNAYTPDGRDMIYTSPAGVHLLHFESGKTKLVLPAPAKAIVVGHKTRSLFYTLPGDGSLNVVDLD